MKHTSTKTVTQNEFILIWMQVVKFELGTPANFLTVETTDQVTGL